MRIIDVDLQGPNVGRGDPDADSTAIASALAQVNSAPDRRIGLRFGSPVRYVTAIRPRITRPGVSVLAGAPGVTTLAPHDAMVWDKLFEVDHAAEFIWDGLGLDVRGMHRPVPTTPTPYSGLWLMRSPRSLITGLTVVGARGFPGAHANACTAAESDDVVMRRSACFDSPTADGFYIQGKRGRIEYIEGRRWRDTLAVLEGSSDGVIRQVHGHDGGALFAVSNFTDADHGNNLVEDCTGDRLSAYSGGGRIATLETAGGHLTGTVIRRITLRRIAGPGIHVYEAPTTQGVVDGVTFEDVTIEDSKTQGVLFEGGRAVRGDVTVRRPGASGVQARGRARDIDLTVDIATDKLTGAIAESVPDITYRGKVTGLGPGLAWGAYFYGACVNPRATLAVTGASHGAAGSDGPPVAPAL